MTWSKDQDKKARPPTLNGQPFGFTWSDVDALSECVDVFYASLHDDEKTTARARDAISRLAALLPPRASEEPSVDSTLPHKESRS